jgi:signal transduction histidine kinase/ActR/RegA family two-component response regulator
MINQPVRIGSARMQMAGEGALNFAPVALMAGKLRRIGGIIPGLFAKSRAARFGAIFAAPTLLIAIAFTVIATRYGTSAPEIGAAVRWSLLTAICAVSAIAALAAWLLMQAHEHYFLSRKQSDLHTQMLMREIEAHEKTDAQLQHAKERAESANVAKTRYVVGISHELRTPLNAIFGYAQLLERDAKLLKPQLESVRVIRRSAEHLANLVDGLLDISRIESGFFRLNPAPTDFIEFLDQLADMMRPQAAAKSIAFIYERAPHIPKFVNADAKRLRQVLLNLLSNAIKYTQAGRVSLTIRYASQVASFEVSDTGIGIPKEDIDRIFEPFERGRLSAVRSIPGTGLGLTIAHLLTSFMGGELTVDSEPGKGSTFRVRVMLSQVASTGSGVAEHPPIRGYQGQRRRILIADDDPAHIQLLSDVLSPLGFKLGAATDGRSALALAAEMRPDAILLDISMPDMTGWAVAQELRKSFGNSIAVLIVSANVHELRMQRRNDLQHDTFLAKPIDIRQLLERLEDVLGIEWTYELPLPIRRAMDSRELPQIAHGVDVDGIIALCRIGHASGVAARIDELERHQPEAAPAIATLRELIREFRLREIIDYLEALRDDEW